MALRKYMHPRNKYKSPPIFKDLAVIYPEFQQHVIIDLAGKQRFNFTNEESLRILAKTLLKHDFDLDVNIPVNKLIPALPLRLNYILWIEDLMKYADIRKIRGLDIGTGAICIYPLLCAKMNGWRMTATEIDQSSVSSAMMNVKHNNLDHIIDVMPVNEKFILKEVVSDANTYSFTMCNPPFFDLDESNRVEKNTPPRNAKTGCETELTVNGGEYSFVHRMIDESMELTTKVSIYTSMIGLKSNLLRCQSELKRRDIQNSTWTEFCQGYTKRWGLAWSFLPKDQLDLTAAPVIRTLKCTPYQNSVKNNTVELIIPLTETLRSVNDARTQLKSWIHELQIQIKDLPMDSEEFDGWAYELCAYEDTWSHARRKRRMAIRRDETKLDEISIRISGQTRDENNRKVTCPEENHMSVNKQLYLGLDLLIAKLNTDVERTEFIQSGELMKICMIYRNGCGGKNALETLRQYLINKFNIRKYMQRRRTKDTVDIWKKKTKM